MANEFLGSVYNNASINNVGEDKVVELMSYSTIEELKHVFYGGLFPFEQDNCLLVIKRIKEYHYHSNPKYTRPSVGVAAEGGGVGYDENDDSACSRVYSQGNRRDLNQKQQTKM
uniref:Uncharacterized protein n=1 Tax=Rhizophagus irregularis (strain DAOM 181602 / DAOM 197198 / MUCL 43194) TaxID=747089 RepID=U9SUF6_RHIID